MENNKLIAEFMQIELISNKEYEIKRRDMIKQDIAYDLPLALDDLKYHSSWDWLMPVVDKIKILVMEDDSDKLYNSEEWDNITHTLVQIEIKSVYQAVVEFIKNQNN